MKKLMSVFVLLLSISLIGQEGNSVVTKLPTELTGSYYVYGQSKGKGYPFIEVKTPYLYLVMVTPTVAFYDGSYRSISKIIKSVQIKKGVTSVYYILIFKDNPVKVWSITLLKGHKVVLIQVIDRKTFKKKEKIMCKVTRE